MKKRQLTMVGAAIGLVVLMASPGATGQAEALDEMAEMSATAQRVEWTPRIEYERMVLTISGQDILIERLFGPGEKPKLELVDDDGRPLPDGNYTWELRAVPRIDPDLRERLMKIRESGDEKALAKMRREGLVPKGPQTRSGYVQVSDGRLASRKEEEESPEPDHRGRGRAQSVAGDLEVKGNLSVSGTKSFVVADPRHPDREIYFAALEGPEAGTYFRGSAATEGGRVVIDLPEVFASVTEAEGLTVQLTPLAGWARLWVEEKSPDRLVVRQVEGDPPVQFDFFVQGVRKGYSGYRVVRTRDEGTLDAGRVAEGEDR